jgi:hypothetical protein
VRRQLYDEDDDNNTPFAPSGESGVKRGREEDVVEAPGCSRSSALLGSANDDIVEKDYSSNSRIAMPKGEVREEGWKKQNALDIACANNTHSFVQTVSISYSFSPRDCDDSLDSSSLPANLGRRSLINFICNHAIANFPDELGGASRPPWRAKRVQRKKKK